MTLQSWFAPLTAPLAALAATLALGGVACSQSPAPAVPPGPTAADAKPVTLVVEDQFARRQDLAAHRGDVVVLVYGDRKATDACKELGEKLHVVFHPAAAGKDPAEARKAPVVALDGVPAGKRSPDALVLPVALIGDIPNLVRDIVRGQIKKASPEVPVWLDFSGTMEKQFGLRPGEPNIVVFDGDGRLRLRVNGNPDQPAVNKLLQTVQNLRAEAAGLAKGP